MKNSLIQLHIYPDNKQCAATFEYGDLSFGMNIASVTSNTSRNVLNDEDILKFFNEYVKSRNLERRLYTIYKRIPDQFSYGIVRNDIINYLKDILEIFDLKDIQKFIKSKGMIAPESLPSSFDMDNELNKQQTKAQTYLKEEYFGLVSLMITFKSLIPLMAVVNSTYSGEVMYILLRRSNVSLLRSLEISRLTDYIKIHILHSSGNEDNSIASSTMCYNIPNTELHEDILGKVLFETFLTSPIKMCPPNTGHIVSKIYYAVDNKFNSVKKPADKFQVKTYGGEDGAGGEESTQSIVEAIRQSSDKSIGDIVILRKAYFDITRLAKSYKVKDMKLVYEIKESIDVLDNSTKVLHDMSVFIFKLVMVMNINGRRFDHSTTYNCLDRYSLINGLSVFSAFLIENGFLSIAKYLVMDELIVDSLTGEGGEVISKSFITKPDRLKNVSKESYGVLTKEFVVYNKKRNGEAFALDRINLLANTLNIGYFKYLLPERFLTTLFMTQDSTVSEEIAKLLIFVKKGI